MGNNRNKPRNQQGSQAGGQTNNSTSEKPMNDEVKQPQDGAAAAGAGDSTNAPAVLNNGTVDQSQQASDSVEAGTTTAEPSADTGSQPESAGTDAAKPDAAPQTDVKDITPPPPQQTVVTPPPSQPVVAKATVVTPPPPAPVVQSTQASAQPSTALSGPTKYDEVNRALAGVPANKLGIIHFLTEYSAKMAPRRPVTEKDGALMQKQLFDAIISLINKEDEHFTQLWSAVLRYVEKEISGVFSHTHAFRFMDNVPLNPEQCQAFASLMHLLRLTGAPSSRQENLKQVSLDKTLQVGVTDSGRQRVLAFYAQ
jgi:hypothetical protein